MVLPPGSVFAGIYAATDRNRGVWKAPANAVLDDVLEPAVKLDRNNWMPSSTNRSTPYGLSPGKGILVWSARTLMGGDSEWRYVPVRRLFNMVEASIKESTNWVVFEQNDENTRDGVRGMIENRLLQKWREGAPVRAKPEEAFYVRCVLVATMISRDILESRITMEIGMAAVKPAEFIISRFSHRMQKS